VTSPSENASVDAHNPDVTVVVIAYNDVRRLPTAVESVLDQTLRNLEVVIVDDASTDGTGEVARGLAEQHSDRVRAITLAENSGGCSVPRNMGIDAARAPYVMFLDSDDTLERHAAKNLLFAAERTGADVVSGMCVRVNVTNNRRMKWYARLYDEHAVYSNIRDAPELLFDTLCTNKLYRRLFLDDNGIRFPPGLHYEDLLFTTEAYCSARGIAVIPVEVYRWHVVEDAETASISNRREDLANFRDRLEIHRRIDAYLEAHGHADLKPVKDRKFILQDLKLYLADLSLRTPDYQQGWIAQAADYLATVDDDVFRSVGTLAGATAYLVRQGDLGEALNAAELWLWGRVSGRLTLRDGRAFISEQHLDDPLGRRLLDITALHLHDAPFSRRNLRNRLLSVESGRHQAVIRGEINDPLGDLDPADDFTATLEMRTIDGRHRIDLSRLSPSIVDAHTLQWQTVLRARARPPRMPPLVPLWELWMTLHHGDGINVSQLVAGPSDIADGAIPWKTVGWTGRTFIRLELTQTSAVRVRLDRASWVSRQMARAWSRVLRSGLYGDLKRLLTFPSGRTMKSLVYRKLLVRLPLRPRTAVFESQLGRVYGDSPKYVYQALRARGDARRVVWSYADQPLGWPEDAVLVKRGTWRYYYELARAEVWVDNQGLPPVAQRRPDATYLQTWHGSPYKSMGYDQPQLQFGPSEVRQQFRRAVERWTHFCVQSPFADEVFARAFRHHATSLHVGYPRNDPLVSCDPAAAKEIRTRLELPDDRRVVLYAPTFRDYRRVTRSTAVLPLNLAAMSDLVGDSCYLLVRAHYLDRGSVAARFSNFARDVSDHHDMTELLLASDALITDYSSVMFDYALLRRPMLFYAYDLDLYTQTRGSYFDLEREAPGPVVRTEERVVAWLRDPYADQAAYRDRLEAFLARYCAFETGKAGQQSVDAVFGTAG
jgi:CDP-glycerol glycerophosphotransferase